ncbi:DNA cytosine methyltransferase [Nocardiopsis dassonvillei]|uniref:DNA cytosine methyltransferase n=1 Tax=Nocardiopsis dassonvillei TaxID=2014 RepID=UPI0036710771
MQPSRSQKRTSSSWTASAADDANGGQHHAARRSGAALPGRSIIRQLECRYVFVENVEALRWRKRGRGLGLHRVLSVLAQDGYDARWTCLHASGVGASHRGEGIFLLAEPVARTYSSV